MKRHLLIAAILLQLPLRAFLQTGYSVLYKSVDKDLPAFMDKPQTGYSRLVCNDTLSFYYFFPGRKDPMKESREYGSKVFHHSVLINLRENREYSGVTYQLPPGKWGYVTDTVRTENWNFTTETKMIAGYLCKKAFLTKEARIKTDSIHYSVFTDTATAWYAGEIKWPYGPSIYHGLPGLVLEVFDQRFYGRHITAESIIKEKVAIMIPDGIPVRTTREFFEKRK